MLFSPRRAAFASIQSAALKSLTSPASFASYGLASKWVISASPDWPRIRFDQAVSLSLPTGLTTPTPVTTTRRL